MEFEVIFVCVCYFPSLVVCQLHMLVLRCSGHHIKTGYCSEIAYFLQSLDRLFPYAAFLATIVLAIEEVQESDLYL